MADDDTPRNADFVARVVKDAKSPPETRMLTGWLGDAAEEGDRRLYTNAELSCYIDIPTDAILHTEPMRDAQPAGCVFVWVKRDAALKPGGSAASRAARFLQGQVQEDFASGASPEAAGFRCITQVPCGEPTGFTGQCTRQPEVGGAWPCITAIPHCFEPTGFTGKCTHQPWPNPTHYIGCTIYHCPTQDLTHIPHICNLVATGMPGCPVVNPPEGGDPAAKESVEGGKEGGGAAAVHPTPPLQQTMIPGCGYTQTWGLCPTLPQQCQVSVNIPCITQTETPGCRGGIDLAAGFRAAGPGPVIPVNTPLPLCNVSVAGACPSAVDACPSQKGCQTLPPTAIQPCTQIGPLCPSLGIACTVTGPQCPTYCGPDCQTKQDACTKVNCTQAGVICTTVEHNCAAPAQPQAFRAAAPIGPTAFLGCTQAGAQCPTYPSGDCTFFGCPTSPQARAGGPAVGCTQSGPQCPTYPNGDCTFFGGCPPTPATVCTQSGPQCPTHAQPHCTFAGPACPPTPATVCTQTAPCHTHLGPHCPTPHFECTMFCTQTIQCGPSAVDACPTRLCPQGGQMRPSPFCVSNALICPAVTIVGINCVTPMR